MTSLADHGADWWSALGTWVAAGVALAGFGGLAIQLNLTRKAAALDVLQKFLKEATDQERLLAAATEESAHQRALVELLNFLELYCAVVNRNLCHGVSRRLIREKIVTSLVILESAGHLHHIIGEAVTVETTFEEITSFQRRHRAAIGSARAAIVGPAVN